MSFAQIKEFLTPHFLTWDMLMIIAVLMFFMILALYLGQRKVILLILSVYVASAIFNVVPESDLSNLIIANIIRLDVVLFAALFIFIFFFFSFSTLYNIIGKSTKRKLPSRFKVGLYGLIAGTLILSIIFSFLEESAVGSFSDLTRQVFLSRYGQIGWNLLPVLAMIVLK